MPTKKPKDSPVRRGARLSSVGDVRRALARTFRVLERGDITASEGRARAQTLKVLADVIVSTDLEARLRALEKRILP